MTWADLAPVIARYGIELAYELWKLATSGGAPTEADWQGLLALARKPMADYLKEARERAGQPPEPPPATPAMGG
jgi:hypothetical protein